MLSAATAANPMSQALKTSAASAAWAAAAAAAANDIIRTKLLKEKHIKEEDESPLDVVGDRHQIEVTAVGKTAREKQDEHVQDEK